MTLGEWSSIPESQQHELVIQWHKNDQWEVWGDMAEEAARKLKDELKSISEVTNVKPGLGKTLLFENENPAMWIREPILAIYTSLPENTRLEQLPARFSGFPVQQINLGDKRDAFLKTLTHILKELKGWSEADTLKWANEQSYESLIDSLNGGFLAPAVYSRGPVTLALYAILDERTREAVKVAGNHYIDLRNDMLSVIYAAAKKAGSTDHYHLNNLQNIDWDSARSSIKELVEKACRPR